MSSIITLGLREARLIMDTIHIARLVDYNIKESMSKKGRTMNVTIPYELKYGVVCITPCTKIDNLDGKRPMVGSSQCMRCTNFVEKHRKAQEVVCRNFSKKELKRKDTDSMIRNPKKVICIETGEIYDSMSDAARKLSMSRTALSKSCELNRKTRIGLTFGYYEE